ncbi:MAG: patatin-like phospholipase family protein [Thiofilum sp.]|uniref:patatin-like phospholipase family protein n=1 Tax=Thiofilum sp. TaxID=2212733 RepID=UPI0025DA5026|nr:patatin-like phospholipase family protein [Thiofilum sp.]MBK8453684.1 patatin-like phospholipase family protein [Thiofilum sp.]
MAQKTIELALQGGGAHGALTWGVLDRLLEESELTIEGVSGTSAGAMNAVVLADGLEAGGREGARQALSEFWSNVSKAALNSPIQRDFWSRLSGTWSLANSLGYILSDHLSRMYSPYQLNPLNINPLRDLVSTIIDFERVNTCRAIKIFVTATNVRTGRPKIFRQPDINADTLMASAALPSMFQAVEIEGEAYWDGGYTGNPALFPLVDECAARDLVLVQINPFVRPDVPKTAHDILNRLNEITFNNSLLKELRMILLLRDFIEQAGIEDQRYREMRLHNIHGDQALLDLEASSKLNAEWAYLSYLRDKGRQLADQWLAQTWDDLGVRSTFEPDWLTQDTVQSFTGSNATTKGVSL